jgi:peptide/nickel transport system substrate-binding protein
MNHIKVTEEGRPHMQADHDPQHTGRPDRSVSRRELLKRAGAGAALLSTPALLAACGGTASRATTTTLTMPAITHTARSSKVVRVGLAFGNSISMDPQAVAIGYIDQIRQRNVFDTLFDFTDHGVVIPRLAESLEAKLGATQWTLVLKPDVVFHDGSPLSSEDVIYSIRRILTKKLALEGYSTLLNIIPGTLRAVDKRTVSIALHAPDAELSSSLAQRTTSIIKAGTTSFASLNGTGPFKHKHETGNRLELVANDDYFIPGRPASDSVTCTNIVDETMRFGALEAGTIDVAPLDSLALLPEVRASGSLRAVISDKTGTWNALVMSATKPPFNDSRVRQAMRLIANRRNLVESAQSGFGIVGNDLFGYQDPLYASSIPQREPDPERAVALLKAAGHADTVFSLHSSAIVGPNSVASALVFAQQARQAGVKVKVDTASSDAYFRSVYGFVGFEQTSYAFRPLLAAWNLVLDPAGTFFAADTDYNNRLCTSLYRTATATLDFEKRKSLMLEAQQIQWDSGGYLLWGYAAWVDATRGNVHGVVPSILNPLSNYALWGIRVE